MLLLAPFWLEGLPTSQGPGRGSDRLRGPQTELGGHQSELGGLLLKPGDSQWELGGPQKDLGGLLSKLRGSQWIKEGLGGERNGKRQKQTTTNFHVVVPQLIVPFGSLCLKT